MKKTIAVLVLLGVCVTLSMVALAREMAARPSVDKEFARLATMYELMKVHMSELETEEIHQELLASLQKEFLQEGDLGFVWETKFISSPDAAKSTLTEFEERGLQRIKEGADEVLEPSATGGARYIRPVRARESCLVACHRPLLSGQTSTPRSIPVGGIDEMDTVKPGDILRFVSLEIAPKHP